MVKQVRRAIGAIVILWLMSMAGTAQAQMPPLYVELWLPYITVGLPSFPPCECDPQKPVCVCSLKEVSDG